MKSIYNHSKASKIWHKILNFFLSGRGEQPLGLCPHDVAGVSIGWHAIVSDFGVKVVIIVSGSNMFYC